MQLKFVADILTNTIRGKKEMKVIYKNENSLFVGDGIEILGFLGGQYKINRTNESTVR